MRQISILNFKGGTGKTSLVTNLAYALTQQKQRVLLVDCDLQANASSLLPEQRNPTLTHVLKGDASFSDAIQTARENLDILPADTKLNTAANHIVATGIQAYNTLRRAARNLEGYDFLLFDHSPNYTSITETALLASNEMLIPCELAPYAVSGLINMITKLTETLGDLDHEVDITGIVPFKLCDLNSISTNPLKDKLTSTWLHSLLQHIIQIVSLLSF